MERFPIRYVSRATGLTADCIRAWEKRYGVITPFRRSGQRLYSLDQVQRLKLLKKAVDIGCRIGQISRMSDKALSDLINERHDSSSTNTSPGSENADNPLDSSVAIDKMVGQLSSYDLDEVTLRLRHFSAMMEPLDFIETILLPLLEKVGASWEQNKVSIAQEHFVSNFLRNLIGGYFNILQVTRGKKIVFATPPGQAHEFGLLASALYSIVEGFEPVYLGSDVPFDELLLVSNELAPKAIVLAVTIDMDLDEFKEQIKMLKLGLKPGVRIMIGGPRNLELEMSLKALHIPHLSSMKGFRQAMAQIGAAN